MKFKWKTSSQMKNNWTKRNKELKWKEKEKQKQKKYIK